MIAMSFMTNTYNLFQAKNIMLLEQVLLPTLLPMAKLTLLAMAS
jgi:hypothetical protein